MEKVEDVSESKTRLRVSSEPPSADIFNLEFCIYVINFMTNLRDVCILLVSCCPPVMGVIVLYLVKVKLSLCKPITRPENSMSLRTPRFGGKRYTKVVSLSALRTGRPYPQEIFWYSFLLEAVSTPGLQCRRKDFVIEKFQ